MDSVKKFTKNDAGFICVNCGFDVPKMGTSSRDHCTQCLYSLHVDINPGDRANDCGGVLRPVGVRVDGKRGYIIEYKCIKCGAGHNCKAATDDDFDAILGIMSHQGG